MIWLNKVVDELIAKKPDGEILVESGVSPSGTYHVGTLREVLTCDAVLLELRRRGRQAKHIHYVDDLDVLRKVPVNVPAEFEKQLGRPLCDVSSPDGRAGSYADYFLNDFLGAAKALHMDMEVVRSHKRYRTGEMTDVLEMALDKVDQVRQIISDVSGRKLEDDWAPIQVMEDGYLKNRRFVSIDKSAKTIKYLDADGAERTTGYAKGEVKLNWRVDWPARWFQLKVDVEPFGRDHATKGGSYDTGAALCKDIFGTEPPLPVPYNFINLSGETKKMSKSTGNIIAISDIVQILPPEVVRFFTLRYSPDKLLFFDPDGVNKLIDEYAELLAKADKTADDEQLIYLCSVGQDSVVSPIPFSHLVASYQAALKDEAKTLDIIGRTEYSRAVKEQGQTIKKELKFIDSWLNNWAPDDVKFDLAKEVPKDLNEQQTQFLQALADKVADAPKDADGEWFHKAIYDLLSELEANQKFQTLYQALIGKDRGPRAGWFLSILPRDWLVERLNLKK